MTPLPAARGLLTYTPVTRAQGALSCPAKRGMLGLAMQEMLKIKRFHKATHQKIENVIGGCEKGAFPGNKLHSAPLWLSRYFRPD